MKKLIAAIVMGMFTLSATPAAFAMKHEMSKESAAALATACKGKKPGDEVTVDGKKVKCPAPEAKK